MFLEASPVLACLKRTEVKSSLTFNGLHGRHEGYCGPRSLYYSQVWLPLALLFIPPEILALTAFHVLLSIVDTLV